MPLICQGFYGRRYYICGLGTCDYGGVAVVVDVVGVMGVGV